MSLLFSIFFQYNLFLLSQIIELYSPLVFGVTKGGEGAIGKDIKCSRALFVLHIKKMHKI